MARERAVLQQQEREIALAVSNALCEVERAYDCTWTSYNRRVAARQHLAAVTAAFDADKAQSELVLDSQRRLAESEIRYFGSLIEYALAIKNVHFEKGSLLDYNDVYLAEGPWPGKAYADAAERSALRRPEREMNYSFLRPQLTVSAGPYGQMTPPSVEPPRGHRAEPAQPSAVPPGRNCHCPMEHAVDVRPQQQPAVRRRAAASGSTAPRSPAVDDCPAHSPIAGRTAS